MLIIRWFVLHNNNTRDQHWHWIQATEDVEFWSKVWSIHISHPFLVWRWFDNTIKTTCFFLSHNLIFERLIFKWKIKINILQYSCTWRQIAGKSHVGYILFTFVPLAPALYGTTMFWRAIFSFSSCATRKNIKSNLSYCSSNKVGKKTPKTFQPIKLINLALKPSQTELETASPGVRWQAG